MQNSCTQHFFPGDMIQAVQGIFSALNLTFGFWGVKAPKQLRAEEGDARVHASGLRWVSPQICQVELRGLPSSASADRPKAEPTVDQTVLRVTGSAFGELVIGVLPETRT